MPRKSRPAVDRILDRCTEDAKGCWVFGGGLSEGYGKAGLGGRGEGTDFCHRITFRHFVGEIPAGLDLDHLCRNRACCNPWHLEPVTRRVNNYRGIRGRGYRPSFLEGTENVA